MCRQQSFTIREDVEFLSTGTHHVVKKLDQLHQISKKKDKWQHFYLILNDYCVKLLVFNSIPRSIAPISSFNLCFFFQTIKSEQREFVFQSVKLSTYSKPDTALYQGVSTKIMSPPLFLFQINSWVHHKNVRNACTVFFYRALIYFQLSRANKMKHFFKSKTLQKVLIDREKNQILKHETFFLNNYTSNLN